MLELYEFRGGNRICDILSTIGLELIIISNGLMTLKCSFHTSEWLTARNGQNRPEAEPWKHHNYVLLSEKCCLQWQGTI